MVYKEKIELISNYTKMVNAIIKKKNTIGNAFGDTKLMICNAFGRVNEYSTDLVDYY